MGFPYPYPLGLPKGSVRSTITMAVSISLAVLINRSSPYANSMSVAAAVCITFYFGGRMRGSAITPRDTNRGQRAWGLPAGTIRSMLTLLYIGIGYYLYTKGKDIPDFLIEILNIIIGYIIGHNFNRFRNRFFPRDPNATGVHWFDHLKAIFVLTLTGLTVYNTIYEVFPHVNWWIFALNVAVGFYFAERS